MTLPRLFKVSAIAVSLAATIACSGDDSSDANILEVSAGGWPDTAVTTAIVTIPGNVITLNQQHLANNFTTRIRERNGVIHVQFVRVKPGNDTIARGAVTLPITQGHVYTAMFARQPAGTGNTCFGCTGALQFPMQGSARLSTDAMWLFYTNRPPLCKGCIVQTLSRAGLLASLPPRTIHQHGH